MDRSIRLTEEEVIAINAKSPHLKKQVYEDLGKL
jgi:hypothetical protein